MRTADRQRLAALSEVANFPSTADPTAQAVPVVSVDARLALVMGQSYPAVGTGQQWKMSNNALYYLLQGLSNAFLVLQAQLATVAEAVSVTRADLGPRLALAEANISAVLLKAMANAEAVEALTQRQAADELANVRLAQQQATDATRLAAVEAQTANQQAQADLNALNLRLLQAQQAKDETALASVQQQLATATTRLDTAATTLASVQAQQTKDEAALASVQAQLATTTDKATAAKATADNALATAQAAQAAQAALQARIRQALIATPSATLQVATPLLVPVVFATPYPDDKYSIELTKAAGGLVGADVSYTNKTGAGFSIQLKNLGVAALLVAASTVDVFTYRNS